MSEIEPASSSLVDAQLGNLNLNSNHTANLQENEADEQIDDDSGACSPDEDNFEDFEEEKQIDDETEGCPHYRCRVESRCIQCKEFFVCRFCHDAKWYDHEMDPKKNH